MQIRSNEEYRRALRRMHVLRARGREEEENRELAELESAVAAYGQQHGKPATTPGRPPLKPEREGKLRG